MLSTTGMHTNRNGSLRAAVVLATGLLAVGFAGCGGSKSDSGTKEKDATAADQAAIKRVLGQLQQAAVAGDGKRICAQIFTPKLADSVTNSAKSGSCAKEVKAKLFSSDTRLTVQDVTVTDPANGTATIKEANGNTSTVFFVRQSGRWRIRSVQPA
jgi:hypothetical protein